MEMLTIIMEKYLQYHIIQPHQKRAFSSDDSLSSYAACSMWFTNGALLIRKAASKRQSFIKFDLSRYTLGCICRQFASSHVNNTMNNAIGFVEYNDYPGEEGGWRRCRHTNDGNGTKRASQVAALKLELASICFTHRSIRDIVCNHTNLFILCLCNMHVSNISTLYSRVLTRSRSCSTHDRVSTIGSSKAIAGHASNN
jgi:hypothetical protein